MEKRDLPRRACIAAVDVIVFITMIANLISLLLSTRPRFRVVLLFLASPNPLVPVTPGPFSPPPPCQTTPPSCCRTNHLTVLRC